MLRQIVASATKSGTSGMQESGFRKKASAGLLYCRLNGFVNSGFGKMASGSDESSRNNQEIQPEEDEIAVVRDTEGVFRHFMFLRFQDETQRGEELGEMNSPSASARPDALEELRSCNDVHPFSQHVPVIGRRLGEIGDEIDAKYKDQFKDMIDSLSLTPATAYETFAAVARRLFRSGINWGRVVALLCFGYEIAVTVIRKGFSGNFLRRIIRFVVDFIFNERIARWIAQHGGWRAVLDFRLSEPSWYTVGIVLMLGTMAVYLAARKT